MLANSLQRIEIMKWLVLVITLLVFFYPQKSEAEPWKTMTLVGSGEYTYLGFISLYKARLFTDGDAHNVLGPQVNRCLVLDYEVEITAEQFAEAATAILQRQLASSEMARISQEINLLHSRYRTVEDGDRYSLCFDSESQTTSLALNGENLVSIRSLEFAAAYFGIWLGEREPINQGLRNDLLGTAGGRGLPAKGGDHDA